jgi:hypothetical protein
MAFGPPDDTVTYAEHYSPSTTVGHADRDIDSLLDRLPGFGRPLLEVEVLGFQGIGFDFLQAIEQAADSVSSRIRQGFGSMSRKRSAISTRRGCLRCMAMPSQ